jgi:hypothetical protein
VTGGEPLSPAKRALLERALQRRRESAGSGMTIARRPLPGPAPLSSAQQRMWFLDQWEPGSPTFNGARALRLRGALDGDALERSLRTAIERHESLRTVIVPGAEPLQRALSEWSFELPVLAGPAAPCEQDLDDLLRELSRRPFDLTSDLMLRATLIELGAEDHVLLLGMHHIAADAHSDRVLFAELAECYDAYRGGRAPNLPTLPIQYADYAVWQRERLQGDLLEELRSYWARTLDGAPELLRLPTDRPRLAVQRHEGSHHRIALDRQLADGLLALGREEGATLFIAMLAAFATLLYRLTGEEDIVIGSPIANRNNLELQGLIGFFTNTIALRTRLGGNPTFREVIGRARATALGAYAHQDMPFDKVVETVAPKRDPGHNPLFQVNFRAQATERPALALTAIEVEPIAVDIGFSRFDLALELELGPQALGGYFEYDRDLFDTASIVGFEERLRALLAQVVEHPDTPILALGHDRGSAKSAERSIRRRSKH